jgi:plasmid replication initiation protein
MFAMKGKTMKKASKSFVIKSNKIIDRQLFRTPLQFKIFCKLIIEVSIDPETEYYTFKVQDILEELKVGEKNHFYLKKQLKELIIASVEINIGRDYRLIPVFQVIQSKMDTFSVLFKVNEEVKPIFQDFTAGFTRYYLENILALKSAHHMVIYEFLKRYEDIHRTISVEKLKVILNIKGDQYERYFDFKNRILLPAQKKIKEQTDIAFTFDEIKTGRRITDLLFKVTKNKVKKDPKKKAERIQQNNLIYAFENDPIKQDLFGKLTGLGITDTVAKKIINTYSHDRIDENIRYGFSQMGKIGNISAWLVDAIKEDYVRNL